MSGSYRIEHDFADPETLENIGSHTHAIARITVCSDAPASFQLSQSGAIECTHETVPRRRVRRP